MLLFHHHFVVFFLFLFATTCRVILALQQNDSDVWKPVGSTLVVGELRNNLVGYTTVRVAISKDGNRLVAFRVERDNAGDGNYTGRVISYELVSSPNASVEEDWQPTETIEIGAESPVFTRPYLVMDHSGNRILVGADDAAEVGGYEPQVYEWNDESINDTSSWQPLGRNLNIVADLRGSSLDGLAMNKDGSRVAMAYGRYIRVFDYNATIGDWTEQEGYLPFINTVRCMAFDASGDRLVVGIYSDTSVVLGYNNTVQAWSLLSLNSLIVEGSGPTATSWFGYDCDISAAGSRIVVGAPKSNRALIYDERAGILENAEGNPEWALVGEVIGLAWSQLGDSVAFSSDGNRLAAAMGMADWVQVYSPNDDPSNKTWSRLGEAIPCVYRGLFGPGMVALTGTGNRLVVGQDNLNGGYVDVYDCSTCGEPSPLPSILPPVNDATPSVSPSLPPHWSPQP